MPQSGAPQREIYQSELAQSQEDIARLTRTIIRGCDEYGSREHRDYGEEANNDNDAAPAEAQAEAQAAKQAVAQQRLRYRYWSRHRQEHSDYGDDANNDNDAAQAEAPAAAQAMAPVEAPAIAQARKGNTGIEALQKAMKTASI